MNITQIVVSLDTGGNSVNVAMTAATSAQGPVVQRPTNWPAGVPVPCLFTPDNTCFARKGTNPTALNDGTDIQFLANTTYRIELMPGERIAAISTAGGNFKFTPNA